VQDAANEVTELEVRPPVGGRLGQLFIAAVGGWLALVVTLSLAGKGTIWAVLAGASLVVWVVYFYRLTSMVVVIRGDTLTVRNLLRTRHLQRSVVSDVSYGESSIAKSPNQTVIVTTSGGLHVPLEACARSLQSRRKKRRVEEFHRRVTDWSSELPEDLELVAAE
jgi:hypothetical protein